MEQKPEKKSMYYFEFHPKHKPGVTTWPAVDWNLKKVLDVAKLRCKKSFMYLNNISGIPGTGKSTLAQTMAAYVCPWFSEKYICYGAHGEKGFIKVSNDCPNESAIVLDESFRAFNSQGTATKEFQEILAHILELRQKKVYVFMCICNWFSMSMTISLDLASQLFYTYATRLGVRGKFLAWGRPEKRHLWVKGKRFMSYGAHPSNFTGRFYSNKDKIIDQEEYEACKLKSLRENSAKLEEKPINNRNYIINKLHVIEGWKTDKLCDFFGLKPRTITGIIHTFNDMGENGAPTLL